MPATAKIGTWQRLNLAVRAGGIVLALLALGYIAWHGSAGAPATEAESRDTAIARLRGLGHDIREKDALGWMQRVFPEGAMFTATLYGLAWTNVAAGLESGDALRTEGFDEKFTEALIEARWALDLQNSPVAVAPFRDTQVRRGVFWLGQRNLLLGQYLALVPDEERPGDLVDEFHHNSRELHAEFLASPTRHLDSYPEMCWPADNVTALVSLVWHDELYGTGYRGAYEAWRDWTIAQADPGTGLPPGHLYAHDGRHREPARGCGTSWILPLLARVDPEFATDSYEAYVQHFALRRLGFRMFREWPRESKWTRADADSGPIIWGAGLTATGVGLAAARAVGDGETEADIVALSRLFGFPTRETREGGTAVRSLWGWLPVGDAFLAWGESLPRPSEAATPPGLWSRLADRWPFFVLIAALATVEVWSARRLWRRWRRRPTIDTSASG